MAVTVAQALNGSINRRGNRAGDPFGGGIPLALVAIAVTLVGFWATFFSQLGHVDAAHMLHGTASTGWLLLVLAQATLIRYRQFKWHRVIGWSSLLLFAVLLASSWHMMALFLSDKGAPMPFQFAKLFVYSDVTALPLFIICYVGAIALRKDRHVHSRLVSTTLLAGLLPAIARMFARIWTGLDGLIFSMHPTYIFVLVILGIAIVVDWRKDRLRWPFPFAFVWFAISYATLFPGTSSMWFDHLAKAIAATA
jgi:hypothetical protein